MKMKSDLEIQFDVENVDTASCTRRGPRDVSLLSSECKCFLFKCNWNLWDITSEVDVFSFKHKIKWKFKSLGLLHCVEW
jgi:hypothetical protein